MELSLSARLLFIGLWNFCDDRGVHPASYKTLKAEVLPADDVTVAEIEVMVQEMIEQGLLMEFEANGRRWWHVTGWSHQKINRPTPSRYPSPPQRPDDAEPLPEAAGPVRNDRCDSVNGGSQAEPTVCSNRELEGLAHGGEPAGSPAETGAFTEGSMSAHGVLTEDSPQEGKGREGRGGEDISHRTAKKPREAENVDGGGDATMRGALAKALRELGVTVTPSHPAMVGWVRDGITQERLVDAVERCRAHKPLPEQIPANYLDKVVRDKGPPKRKQAQRETLEERNRRVAEDWKPPELRGEG